jgi:hypothetical protein
MYNKSFAIGFAAMALAGAFGLAMIGPANAMSNKQCGADWKAAEAAGTATGMTYRDFQQSHCKGGAEPAAAPAAASTPAPAPAATPTAAAAPAPAMTPAAAATPMTMPMATPKPKKTPAAAAPAAAEGAGQFAAEAEAKAHCPSDTVVWLNTTSHKYHFAGHKSYGTTKHGAYMCEADAKAAGNAAAKGEEPK